MSIDQAKDLLQEPTYAATQAPQPIQGKGSGRLWAWLAESTFLLTAAAITLKAIYLNANLGFSSLRPGNLLWPAMQSLLLFSLIAVIFVRKRGTIEFIANVGFSLVVLTDLIYYRYFNDLPSITVIANYNTAGSIAPSIASLFRASDLLVWLDLPLHAAIWKNFHMHAHRRSPAVVALLAILALSLTQKTFILQISSLFDKSFQPGWIVERGILYYHVQDALKVGGKYFSQLSPPSEKDIRNIALYLHDRRQPANKYSGVAKGANLILIQVESLQGFVVGRKVAGQEITPHLNKLITRSLYYPNIYPQVGKGNTSDAEFLTQTSLYPYNDAIAYWLLADNRTQSLAGIVKSQGYHTWSSHAYFRSFYNRQHMHRQLGFEASRFEGDFVNDEMVGWGLGDKSFLRQSAVELAKLKTPYYGFLITLSSHYPFDGSYPSRTPLDTSDIDNPIIANYIKSIHYADEAIGDLVSRLESTGALDNTVIALYGDHSAIPPSLRHELTRYMGVTDTDLNWFKLQKNFFAIRTPVGIHETITHHAGQIDIAPTVLNVLGIDSPSHEWFGRDLSSANKRVTSFVNGSWTSEAYTAIKSIRHGTVVYDNNAGTRVQNAETDRLKREASDQIRLSNLINRFDLTRSLPAVPPRGDSTKDRPTDDDIHALLGRFD